MRDNSFFKGIKIDKWGLLVCCRCDQTTVDNFCDQLSKQSQKLAMPMKRMPAYVEFFNSRRSTLKDSMERFTINIPDMMILMVIVDGNQYGTLLFLYFHFESTLCSNVIRFPFIKLLMIDHGSFLRPIIQAASTIASFDIRRRVWGKQYFSGTWLHTVFRNDKMKSTKLLARGKSLIFFCTPFLKSQKNHIQNHKITNKSLAKSTKNHKSLRHY